MAKVDVSKLPTPTKTDNRAATAIPHTPDIGIAFDMTISRKDIRAWLPIDVTAANGAK